MQEIEQAYHFVKEELILYAGHTSGSLGGLRAGGGVYGNLGRG